MTGRSLTPLFVLVGSLLLLTSCHPMWEPDRELRRLAKAGDVAGSRTYGEAALKEHLGEPFPNLPLVSASGQTSALTDYVGEPIAVFFAHGPCPHTMRWIEELQRQNWRVEGRTIVTLVKFFEIPELSLALRDTPAVYSSSWPLPSYLSRVRFYPVMFFVDEKGNFEGYYTAYGPRVTVDETRESR